MARGDNVKLVDLLLVQQETNKAIAAQATMLAVLTQRVEDTHQRLFGNGQPGVIQDILGRCDQIEGEAKRVGGKVIVLERRIAWLSGIAAGAGAALGALGKTALDKLGLGGH